MKVIWLLAFLLWMGAGKVTLHAQQVPQKFVQETHYLLYLPDGYNSDTVKKWPLLIFLHGSGESGNDLEKVKLHGPPELVEKGKSFPFIVVSPQAKPREGWEAENLYRLLQHIKQTQRVDEKRIYLTGLSMGGFGTWEFAMRHPEEFAAIAPVCGGGDTTEAWKLRNIAVWNFHGAKDDVVLPVLSDNMVNAVKRYNPSIRYTLYPDANHNSWDATYSNDSLYLWMLSKTKFRYKEVPISPDIFKQYTGKYTSGEKDTVVITVDEHNLVAKADNAIITLKAAGNDLFFVEPDLPLDVRFPREKGIVRSLLLMGNNKKLYRKIQ
ncbi:MAG: dienelactone hydrolase family protein [Chitinophagaceae bacterium]|nr:dienelactone hydrolase family protein [Chitinophagaceae bacterium]